MSDEESGFSLAYTPKPSKSSGPDRDTRIIRSGDAMLRLVDDGVDLTDLAAVAMIDLSVASRRVKDARERRERSPEKPKLTGPDTRYLAKRYRDSSDPAVKAFLQGINTRRRRRA